MTLIAHSPVHKGWQGTARITTQHFASIYGQAVLVVEDEPVGTFEAILADFEILSATDRERELLRWAGYRVRGL